MSFIDIKNLIFKYKTYIDEKQTEEKTVLDDLTLSIEKGAFVGILGSNGSGKSTLAKQISAQLFPTEGVVWLNGLKTSETENILKVRQTAGIVFQNPDNQMVGNTVEEDVAFGPENLGVPRDEMIHRIEHVLEVTGMSAYRNASPNHLSGGQKQRVAISGILAMEPECIILDEPTAMLDPKGRQDILDAVRYLNKEQNITILYITHHVEEVTEADYLYVMDQGKIFAEGIRQKILQVNLLEQAGLELPFFWKLKKELEKQGIEIPPDVQSEEALLNFLSQKEGGIT